MTTRYVDVQSVLVTAGAPNIIPASGAFFVLMEAAGPVTISFRDSYGRDIGSAAGVLPGFKVPLSDDFTTMKIDTDTDQVIKYGCGIRGVDYNRITGQVQLVTALVLTDAAPVAVGIGAADLIAAADSTRTLLSIGNPTTDVLCIGGAGVTAAGAVYRLQPGDVFESPAPAAAHYGVFETAAGNATVLEGA